MERCPACKELLVIPREGYSYCEDCGWPDEDFGEAYGYPALGDRLEKYQPYLQFYGQKDDAWVPSGVITKTMKESDRGFYRYPISREPKGGSK